jgi:hypothetical protein
MWFETTTCVATGEDRRFGDFFTNALDERGCVIIGSGDTTTKDPLTGGERQVALPLFMRQNSGPALRGTGDCSPSSGSGWRDGGAGPPSARPLDVTKPNGRRTSSAGPVAPTTGCRRWARRSGVLRASA